MPRKVYIKPRSSTQKAYASHRAPQQKGILSRSFFLSYKVYLVLLLIIAAVYAYVFLFSSWYTVSKVSVRVEHGTAQDQQMVEEALSRFFSEEGDSRFHFNRQLVLVTKERISFVINQVMAFQDISINRVIPHELRVSLVLEAPQVIWREVDGRDYYLSASGEVLKAKQEQVIVSDAFLIEKATGTPVVLMPGAHALDTEPIRTLQAFRDAFNTLIRDFTLSKAIYDPDQPQTLKIVTNEGWHVIVDQQTNMMTAVSSLQKVLQEMIGVSRLKLQYVDLRVENKVFYK